jgi:ppGpp synthetase/RelA/SpoT-type nucleotidyltranferase
MEMAFSVGPPQGHITRIAGQLVDRLRESFESAVEAEEKFKEIKKDHSEEMATES